jgi:hypothetical protein
MKRAYQKPEVIDVTICGEIVMLRASESTRNLGGGVTEKVDGEKVLSPKILEYDNEATDPFAGHGHGTGGGGNRSKVWDEVDEDF